NSIFSHSYHIEDNIKDEYNDIRANVGLIAYDTVSIVNSIFENSHTNKSGALSFAIWNVYDNVVNISNSTFRNNFGFRSGAIRTAGFTTINIENSKFYNNTSMNDGIFNNAGDLTSDGVKYHTHITCNKCYFENPYNNDYHEKVSGKIITSSGYGDNIISNSVINNFKYGDLYRSYYSKIKTLNTTFSNMSLNGPLMSLLNENESFEFDNCEFKNIDIKHEEYGLIYTNKNSGNLKISDSTFSNITSYNAAVILTEINFGNNVEFYKNKFEDVYSRNGIIVIKNEDLGTGTDNYNGIYINNCEFKNCSSAKSCKSIKKIILK
ncbi:hypothetical protein PIROE2DRAFT_9041, partial [Piromyces sp. E2]